MILKFQSGAPLPLVSYTPMITTAGGTQQVSPATTTSTKKEDPFEKIFDLLKSKDLLPSDLDAIKSQITSLSQNILNPNITSSKLLNIYTNIGKAVFYNKEYESAYNLISEKGGLNELAINDRGQLLGYNKETKDYKFFTVDEIYKQKNYIPLTNSELLELRAINPQLAFNPYILQTVKNGTGMEEINTMIMSIVDKIGTNIITKDGYYDARVKKGLTLLQEAVEKGLLDPTLEDMSIKGLYKNKLITESQANQITSALKYIFSTLPINAKTLLKTKALESGTSYEELIFNLIASTSDTKLTFSTDLEKNKDGELLSGSKQINIAEAFQNDLGSETILPINAGGTDTLYIQAYSLPINTKTGEPIGITSLKEVANNSAYSGILNFSQVSMGNQRVDMSALNNIQVDGTAAYKVYLPYDQEAAARNIIKPNLEYLNKLEEVRKEIKKNNITDPNQINEIYKKYNLPKFIDENGKPNIQFYKPFAVLNGSAFSGAFDVSAKELKDNKYFEEITGQRAQNIYNQLGGGDLGEFDEFDPWFGWGFLEGDYQSVFKGLVFIPMKLDPVLGIYSGGDEASAENIMELQDNYNKKEAAKKVNIQGQL